MVVAEAVTALTPMEYWSQFSALPLIPVEEKGDCLMTPIFRSDVAFVMIVWPQARPEGVTLAILMMNLVVTGATSAIPVCHASTSGRAP